MAAEYKPVSVPPGVEMQARELARFCEPLDWRIVTVTVIDGALSRIAFGDGEGESHLFMRVRDGWCEVVEVDDEAD